MTSTIPPPDLQTLLPPLLALLPNALASPQPPPALLPLLSPILRQRVQHLSASVASPPESWLPVLSFQARAADMLLEIVKSKAFKPKPVSGELEYGKPGVIWYRRLDKETLQAQTWILGLGIIVVYSWGEDDGSDDDGAWQVAEVIPIAYYQSYPPDTDWFIEIALAEEYAV